MDVQALKCFLVLNAVQREESLVWGVDCNINFDYNIIKALQFIALNELAGEDCPLKNPDLCEANEYIEIIKGDSFYQCHEEDVCESNVHLTCSLTVFDPTVTSNCNTLGLLEILN